MTNEITTMAKTATKAAVKKVGEVEMSRRSFLKIGLITTIGAYDAMTGVTDKLNELAEPSLLDKALKAFNFDFVDRAVVKWYLFDRKMQLLIGLVRKVENFFK